VIAADDSFGGLVAEVAFVLIAVLAWIIKSVSDRRQAHALRTPRPHAPHVPPLPARPERPRPEPAGERAAQEPAAPSAPERLVPERIKRVASAAHTHVHVRRVRRSAWRRLGVTPAGRHAALRRAVLWREVLGPPRALLGPHRPPHRARRARGAP
jgi:hypothetical protein